ncbi:MAG: monovalent cation/H+ antiporter complex subunit F [Eubacteriaceae bacterium]|nr:monovalent cation/H+ antiporter complex subunit F [Eubacteriaceae bacterium]
MVTLFKILLVVMIITIGMMIVSILKGPSTFDRLNGILVISTDIIVSLLLIGLIDGRMDMYIDIAISYAILGFLGTVFIADFLKGGNKKNER